ncbi:MAG: hemolysin III family protein [Planctomycetes bacterium]|nr:hemolysin III family protein [Planctomycetota bacterium]
MPAKYVLDSLVRRRYLRRTGIAVERTRRTLRRSPDHDEENVNTVTHALGLACGVAGAALVIWAAARHGSAWQVWGCAVYAVTLVAVYAASMLSHAVRRPQSREVLRIADQAVIFLFIAGSYTPVALTWLRSGPWWAMHALVWAGAVAGFTAKAVFAHNVRLGGVSTALYMLLGWLPVLVGWPLLMTLPGGLVVWLFAGGLCYSAGTVFFRYDHHIRYFHAAWHVLVLAGSACHFLGIFFYCTSPSV